MPWLSFSSPLGMLTLTEEDDALVALDWGQAPKGESSPLLEEGKRQLDDYFDGRRRDFNLPLRPAGTPFQLRVWTVMQSIPYGGLMTYLEMAKAVNSAPRAIGGACGRNPLPIIIPCHRVVASDGSPGGYSGLGGLETKQYLLDLEQESMENGL